MPDEIPETVTVEILFLPWANAAALKIEIATSIGERWRLRTALEIAVKVGARLDGAILDSARLDGARLDGASLVGARLDGAILNRASLDGASLDGAILNRARLDGASLDGASLDGARLDGASLVGASLDGAILNRASGIICAGFDPGGYRFLGVRHADQWYVAAGFRWFTIPAAIAHWTAAKNRDALARVGVIQVAAGGGVMSDTDPTAAALDALADAAPELLAALKASLEVMDRYNGHHEVKNHAADIIAKAEGRT